MKAKVLVLVLIMMGTCPLLVGQENDYWFQKGVKATDPKEKIEYYTKSIEKEGVDAAKYFNCGIAKSKIEDYEGALADFTKAIELGMIEGKVYYQRGDSKFYLEDYKGAITDYNKALELWPEVKYICSS